MKKEMKCLVFGFVLIIYSIVATYAQSTISFPDVDINAKNEVLFTGQVTREDTTWKNLYKTTVIEDENTTQASNGDMLLLNCFPQTMDVLHGGNYVQIRNADGIFMYSLATKSLEQHSHNSIFDSSLVNDARSHDNTIVTSISPDGNWLCYFKKKSPTTASLMLSNTRTGEERVINANADFSFNQIPVIWADDSSTILYEKEDGIYFLEITNIEQSIALEEVYRKIGDGSINNVAWPSSREIVYIDENIVYSVSTNELYTRALYSDLLGSGKVLGRLPWAFNGNADTFWVDESATQLIVKQGDHSLYYFELEDPYAIRSEMIEDTRFVKALYSQGYLPVLDAAVDFDVFWVPDETREATIVDPEPLTVPLLWFDYADEKNNSMVYVLNNEEYVSFEQIDVPSMAGNALLSKDKTKLAFTAINANDDKNLYVYDLSTLTQLGVFEDENVITFEWKDNNAIFVGGDQTVKLWNFASDNSDVLFLSAIEDFAWDKDGIKILAENNSGTFEYNPATKTWLTSNNKIENPRSSMNENYRIMTSENMAGRFENILFVRSLKGQSETRPLFENRLEAEAEQKSVSLVFDALDNREGLSYVLKVLAEYNLTGSFFINGEFLKRYPDNVLQIVEGNHEVASMFYTTADLAIGNFIIDEEFIRRGLANTEDEFYALTGKDIEMYWHTPYYRTSELIETSGDNAGYVLLDDVLEIDDTVTLEQAASGNDEYKSANQIIEDIIPQLYDGAVIPISVGISKGSRYDYVYEKLDILIHAIYEAGFAIDPVSSILY